MDYLAATFGKWELCRISITGGAPTRLTVTSPGTSLNIGRDGRVLLAHENGAIQVFDPGDGKTEDLGRIQVAPASIVLWSPDEKSVAYVRSPAIADDPNAGLWVDDFKSPPHQIFRGWVSWLTRGKGNEIDFLEGKPDLASVLWALTRDPAIIPSLYSSNYLHTILGSQFAASPDGRYVALQTDQVLEENIGMIENAR